MLRRTKGRFLLTLLVVTGLAGALENSSLKKDERKTLINEYKESKTLFHKSIKGLSEERLNFKPAPGKWSISECIHHIALTDKVLWDYFAETMKKPTNSEERANLKLSDEDVLKMITDRSRTATAPEVVQPGKCPWKNSHEAAEAFRMTRLNELKHIRTTTEDLRNRVLELPVGKVDCYQFLLYISGHARRHISQIEEVKLSAGFPKK